MSSASKLTKLVVDHAHWSDEVRRLKSLGINELSLCSIPSRHQGGNCLSDVHFDYRNRDNPYEYMSYEDFYQDSVAGGHVCEHCIAARELRKQRMIARRRLGQIRSAITMTGRKINNSSNGVA